MLKKGCCEAFSEVSLKLTEVFLGVGAGNPANASQLQIIKMWGGAHFRREDVRDEGLTYSHRNAVG